MDMREIPRDADYHKTQWMSIDRACPVTQQVADYLCFGAGFHPDSKTEGKREHYQRLRSTVWSMREVEGKSFKEISLSAGVMANWARCVHRDLVRQIYFRKKGIALRLWNYYSKVGVFP